LNGSTPIYSESIGYTNGQISSITDLINGTWAYTYDDFARIKTADCSAGCENGTNNENYAFAYDEFGNRWSQTFSGSGTGWTRQNNFDRNNHITPATCANLNTVCYDSAGNKLYNGDGTQQSFDSEGKIWYYGNQSGQIGSYVWDAASNRIERTVTAPGLNVVLDYVDGTRTEGGFTGNNISTIDLHLGGVHVNTYVGTSTTYFNHQDHLGDTRTQTDPTGAQNNSFFQTLPFGDWTAGNLEGNDLFAGDSLLESQDSNMYQMPNRRYDEYTAQWQSPDPAGLAAVDPTNPQSWNRYAYVMNNPMYAVDPTGLDLIQLQWEGGSGLFDSDALIAAGFNIEFGDDGDVSSIEPPNSAVQITDESGNITGTIGPDSNVFAGVVQLDQSVTVTASPDGGPETMSAVTGNYIVTPGAYGGPMAPSAQRMLNKIARSAPRICGGGAFVYGGLHGDKGNLEGAGMGLLEYDTQAGWQTGSLLEGSAGPVGLARIDYSDGGGTEYLLLAGTPFAGTFGSKSSFGVYGGSPTFGAGAYVNITTNAGCKHK
jgi:RHS repeat-associated protein